MKTRQKLHQFKASYPSKKIGPTVFFSSAKRALAYAENLWARKVAVEVVEVATGVRLF